MARKYTLLPRIKIKEIIKEAARECGMPEEEVKLAYDKLFESILKYTKEGKIVVLTGLGQFQIIRRGGGFATYGYGEDVEEGRFDVSSPTTMPDYNVLQFKVNRELAKTIRYDSTIKTMTDVQAEYEANNGRPPEEDS